MKTFHNVEYSDPDNNLVLVTLVEYTRGGTKSPISRYLIYNNKSISPYEQRKYGWNITVNGVFTKTYRLAMERAVANFNTLLALIPKDTSKGVKIPKPRGLVD